MKRIINGFPCFQLLVDTVHYLAISTGETLLVIPLSTVKDLVANARSFISPITSPVPLIGTVVVSYLDGVVSINSVNISFGVFKKMVSSYDQLPYLAEEDVNMAEYTVARKRVLPVKWCVFALICYFTVLVLLWALFR